MNKPVIAGGAAVVLLGLGAWWYFGREPAPEPEPEPEAAAPVAEAPAIKNPVATADDGTLPALDASDGPLAEALGALLGTQAVQQFLIPKDLIRHIVVTIDNLPRKKLAVQLRPIAPTPGELAVTATGETFTLSPANAARYLPFMKVVDSTDTQAVAAIYLRFYPLFQQAYEGLGYPSQYFNDRLVEVIDHLLATPDLTGPIPLTRPSVMYVYADPALEALSSGQKTLLRMGPQNAAVIKARLIELKTAVAARKP
ncbi:MAG: hypothetical protein RLZZ403_1445 [Pseudomonadota bacterium]|jgi:hypothetical protein